MKGKGRDKREGKEGRDGIKGRHGMKGKLQSHIQNTRQIYIWDRRGIVWINEFTMLPSVSKG